PCQRASGPPSRHPGSLTMGLRAAGPLATAAGPQGQSGHDEAHASGTAGAAAEAGARAAVTAEAAVTAAITGVRRAGHELRITGEGGGGGRVAVVVPVAVLAVVVFLVLLGDLTQVRRDLVPGLAGEDRGGDGGAGAVASGASSFGRSYWSCVASFLFAVGSGLNTG